VGGTGSAVLQVLGMVGGGGTLRNREPRGEQGYVTMSSTFCLSQRAAAESPS